MTMIDVTDIACMSRLRASDEVSNLCSKLRSKGVPDRWIDDAMRYFASGPARWHLMITETTAETRARRLDLAQRMREFARELKADWDLAHRSIVAIEDGADRTNDYEIRVVGMKYKNRPTIGDIVALMADDLEELRVYSWQSDRRTKLESFVLREIFDRLQWLPFYERRAPNNETEIIASAVLGSPVRRGAMTDLRKEERRRYCRD